MIAQLFQTVATPLKGALGDALHAVMCGTGHNRRLILAVELSPGERRWLDAYHAEVAEKLGSRVSGATVAWLKDACAPI